MPIAQVTIHGTIDSFRSN